MPDRHLWSAAMLLRWVLTRDADAVFGMIDDYGAVVVSENTVTSIRPAAWEDLVQEFVASRSSTEANPVKAAQQYIIPAWQSVYANLQAGKLEAWSRPNGSGDLIRLEPVQWAGLRIRSLDGHDLAVPVNNEKDPLPLPHLLRDYLLGSIPTTNRPTVWPDPVFPAEQIMELWPPRERASHHIAAETDSTQQTISRGAGGRRQGSGAIDDTDALGKMLQLLAADKAVSVWDAAAKIAKDIKGQSGEAVRKRIYDKFRAKYGTEPPEGGAWGDIAG